MKKIIVLLLLVGYCYLLFAQDQYQQEITTMNELIRNKAALSNEWRSYFSENNREMDNYDVQYYKIKLQTAITDSYITGTVEMKIKSLSEQLSQLTFHLDNSLTISQIRWNSQSITYTHQNNLVTITLPQSITANTLGTVAVDYSGHPGTGRLEQGMSFIPHSGTPSMFTLVEPRGSRMWWPCKDMPGDKADSIDVYIKVPSLYKGVSNGRLVAQIVDENGYTETHWHESYPISTYLIFVAATNYQEINDVWSYHDTSLPLINHAFPEQANAATSLYSHLPGMLTYLSDLFGTYPFTGEQYGHTSCARNGIAMEHQTNTMMGANIVSNQSESVMLHELSHQWFGDMITCKNWSNIWLNEGFASFAQLLWAEHEDSLTGYLSLLHGMDQGDRIDGPLYRDESLSGAQILDIVVYYKGAWVLAMLRDMLGDTLFFNSIRTYLQNPSLRYGNALTSDLESAFNQTTGQNLHWFFDQWFNSPGRPKYQYTIYRAVVSDSCYVAFHSTGTQGDTFQVSMPYTLRNVPGRILLPGGVTHLHIPEFVSDNQLEFDPDNLVLDAGIEQVKPVLVSALQTGQQVTLCWNRFFDEDINGYNIYRLGNWGEYIPVATVSGQDTTVTVSDDYTASIYAISAVYNVAYESYSNNVVAHSTGNEDDMASLSSVIAAWPNPFAKSIRFKADQGAGRIYPIDIYNIKGQKIQSLLPNRDSASTVSSSWDGAMSNGKQAAEGVYIIRYAKQNKKIMKVH